MSKNHMFHIVLFLIVIFAIKNSGGVDKKMPPHKPIIKPQPEVVVPKTIPTITLENNFVYDDFDKAVKLAEKHTKDIIIVFGAEWCPYCEVLKKDARSIKNLEKYVVCFIDTDNRKANANVITKYRPRSLPTSVYLKNNKQESSRKIGYRKQDYIKWLNTL